ncbi:hypothetical protein [Psychroserpens sp. MEBiC05023]
MKRFLLILALIFALQVSAQEQSNWITDNTTALNLSKTQNKPILVFVTNNEKSEAYENLNTDFFKSDTFKKFASKCILLKLDVSDKNSTNARLGIHYTKHNNAPGISLINQKGKPMFDPLVVDFSSENIEKFLALWNDNF